MTGHIDPDRAQFDAFKGLDRDQPIHMLNLLALKDRAAYPEGHALAGAGLTGAQAYANYGRDTKAIFAGVGGSITWRGTPQAMLIGPADEAWDIAFVARYPTAHAFLAMIANPNYQAAVVHRQAAVRTSRLIRCGDAADGASFG